MGAVLLFYVLGAASMFFELPPSGFLGQAFLGARAWNERRQLPEPLGIEQTPKADPTELPVEDGLDKA